MQAQDHHKFGNHAITLETLLSANIANMSDEDFCQALAHAGTLNRLLISRAKCNSPAHYEEVIGQASQRLRTILLARRIFDQPTAKRQGLSLDLDAEFGPPLDCDRRI